MASLQSSRSSFARATRGGQASCTGARRDGSADRQLTPASRPFARRLLALLGLCLLVGVASACDRDTAATVASASASSGPSDELPVLGAVPAFRLTRESGVPFGSTELEGKVVIADFVFTSCGSVCPRLTRRMLDLQARVPRLGEGVMLASFSVDPENDTPAVLAAYARDAEADPGKWVFLTGELGAVQEVVKKGFKLGMGKLAAGASAEGHEGGVFHAERFVLLDRERRIRGYYRNEDDDVARLVRDATRLLDR